MVIGRMCLCYTTDERIMTMFGPSWGVSLPNRPVRIDHALVASTGSDGPLLEVWKFEREDGESFQIQPKSLVFRGGQWVLTTANHIYIFKPI